MDRLLSRERALFFSTSSRSFWGCGLRAEAFSSCPLCPQQPWSPVVLSPMAPGMLFCRAQHCASRNLAAEALIGNQLLITSSMDCFRSGCQQELGGCLRRAGTEASRVPADLAELRATSGGGSVALVSGFEAGSSKQ